MPKNFKQKLRHQVMKAEAVEAEALRVEAEAIQNLLLLHSCCNNKNLPANRVTKKCNCINIEIQREIYETIYQNIYQQNLWESELKSYHFKESGVRVDRK